MSIKLVFHLSNYVRVSKKYEAMFPNIKIYVNCWTQEQMHILDVRPGILQNIQ